jgi:tryptophan 2,3-dioxygenase
MGDQREDGVVKEVRWPKHAGVGGVSIHAMSAPLEQRLGSVARDAVTSWSKSGWPKNQAGSGAVRFPYREVLDHYQAVGRAAASALLVAELTEICRSCEAVSGRAEMNDLLQWLRSAIDQLDGDYHSYAVTSLQAAYLDSASQADFNEHADALLLTLLLDLLRTEAEALMAAPSTDQRRRTRSVLQAVARAEQLVPRVATIAPDLSLALGALDSRAEDGEIADTALRISTCADHLPTTRHLVNITLLPTTVLHDEQMFIRMIQIFECLYSCASRYLRAATEILRLQNVAQATLFVEYVADRLAGAPALYRILTTMPPEAFAIIRKYTAGRSAVQSRTYRNVENVSARLPGRDRDPETPETTLEEVFLQAGQWLCGESYEGMRNAMRRLDRRWCAMKRSHWGITLKIIGDVPGTGGTAGAEYLEDAARMPLFPALAVPSTG